MKKYLPIIFISALFTACSGTSSDLPVANQNAQANAVRTPEQTNVNTQANTVEKTDDKPGHEHTAPHGGTLIAFGEEFAHLELVLDEKTGELTGYFLDGEAEKAVLLSQETVSIEVEKPSKFEVVLSGIKNDLTGETKGSTSEFRGKSEKLIGLKDFDAEIKIVKIRGKEFKNTHFNFPKGNESDHAH